jgi:hypothetical protein
MLIESYEFGAMVINGKRYTSDVIVLPERVIDGWWRKEGHKVHVEDLEGILKQEPKPEVLVLGTGYYGLVKILPEVQNTLESHGIELVAQPTKEAWQTFNKLLQKNALTHKSKEKVIVGAFHLTC